MFYSLWTTNGPFHYYFFGAYALSKTHWVYHVNGSQHTRDPSSRLFDVNNVCYAVWIGLLTCNSRVLRPAPIRDWTDKPRRAKSANSSDCKKLWLGSNFIVICHKTIFFLGSFFLSNSNYSATKFPYWSS